jgi:hypothetical protein
MTQTVSGIAIAPPTSLADLDEAEPMFVIMKLLTHSGKYNRDRGQFGARVDRDDDP